MHRTRGTGAVNTFPVAAKLLAPVVIRRDRQSQRSATARSVSGTIVRGALASIYLQQWGEPDETFSHVFLDESVCRFHPLDPGPSVLPLTSVACKRASARHGVEDTLWFRVAQHLAVAKVPDSFEERWRRCRTCGADLKLHFGFGPGNESSLRDEHDASHRIHTHVGIDRRTGTAADSIFYTLEALMPTGDNVDLYGRLQADEKAFDCVTSLLESEDGRISVGHARTRGYGDVQLQLRAQCRTEEASVRMSRWEAWSRKLTAFLNDLQFVGSAQESGGFFFALSFPNGAVLVDRLLRYSLDPAKMVDWLPAMPETDSAFPVYRRPVRELSTGGTLRWIAGVTWPKRLRGWNAAHGLPRQDEWAVARGATYVYSFKGSEASRRDLLDRLVKLSESGAGLRRNEGFGSVLVSDAVHCHSSQKEE